MRHGDDLVSALASLRPHSFAPRMAPFFQANYKHQRLFHDAHHPSFYFFVEMFRQSCVWLGLESSMPSAEDLYTEEHGNYFTDVFHLPVYKTLAFTDMVEYPAEHPRSWAEFACENAL
jgi:hypothetical protein